MTVAPPDGPTHGEQARHVGGAVRDGRFHHRTAVGHACAGRSPSRRKDKTLIRRHREDDPFPWIPEAIVTMVNQVVQTALPPPPLPSIE